MKKSKKIINEKRRCTICKKWLSLNYFNKDKTRTLSHAYICKGCEKIKRKRYHQKNGEAIRKKDREWEKRNKKKVFEHYSNGSLKCANCEYNVYETLTIDHINGGGSKHRKKLNVWGNRFYEWLIRNKFPKRYQVLCHNCNFLKERYPGIYTKTAGTQK